MKYVLLIFILMVTNHIWSMPASGELLVVGKVTLQNSGNQPVAGAQVSVGDVGTATVTDAKGIFQTKIILKEAGESISIKIEKYGFEVVNRNDLLYTLELQIGDTLRLFMCPEGAWEKNALEYYQFNLEKIYSKYNYRIKELEKSSYGTKENLDKAQRERDMALDAAHNLANHFAVTNLDFVSDFHAEAFEKFKKGDIEGALEVLRIEGLDALRKKIDKEYEEGRSMVRIGNEKIVNAGQAKKAGAEDYALRAQLMILAEKMGEVEGAMQLAINADSTNWVQYAIMGQYLNAQREYKRSISFFDKALALSRKASDSALIYTNLAVSFEYTLAMEQAKLCYSKALEIRRDFAGKAPGEYNEKLIASLLNMGNICRELGEVWKAKDLYKEAILIMHSMGPDWADKNVLTIATSLNNSGIIFENLGYNSQAEEMYAGAIELRRNLLLTDEDSLAALAELALVIGNLGRFYVQTENYKQGLDQYQEAQQLLEVAAYENPAAYQYDLANTLNGMAMAYKGLKTYNLAEQTLLRAKEIFALYFDREPETYGESMAMIETNLGKLYKETQRYEEAEVSLQKSLELIHGKSREFTDMQVELIARIKSELGLLFKVRFLFSKAEVCFKESLELRKSLAEKKPYLAIEIARTHGFLGELYLMQFTTYQSTNLEKAKIEFNRAFFIWDKVFSEQPERFRKDVFNTLNKLGDISMILESHEDAESYYQRGLEISRSGKEHSTPQKSLIANALENLATLADRRSNLQEAVKYYEEALAIHREIESELGLRAKEDIARVCNNVGQVYASMYENDLLNSREKAGESFKEACRLMQELEATGGEMYLSDLTTCMNSLANHFRSISKYDSAHIYHSKIIHIREGLALSAPSIFNYNLACSHYNLALVDVDMYENFYENQHLNSALLHFSIADSLTRNYDEDHPGVLKFRTLVSSQIEHIASLINQPVTPYTMGVRARNIADSLEKEKSLASALVYYQEAIFYLESIEKADRTGLDLLYLNLSYVGAARISESVRSKILYQRKALDAILALEKLKPGTSEINQFIGKAYGNLAFYLILDEQFQAAETEAQNGLKADPGEFWIYSSLALALLFQDKFSKTEKIYLEWKNKLYKGENLRIFFLDQLDKVEEAQLFHRDLIKARSLL